MVKTLERKRRVGTMNRKPRVKRSKRITVSSKNQIHLPKEFVDTLGIENELICELDGDAIVLRKPKKQVELPEGISEDFFDVLDDIMGEYDEALRMLKDR